MGQEDGDISEEDFFGESYAQASRPEAMYVVLVNLRQFTRKPSVSTAKREFNRQAPLLGSLFYLQTRTAYP